MVGTKILEIKDLSFLPKNNNPVGLSNFYLASIWGSVMVSRFGTMLMKDKVKGMNRSIVSAN